MAVGEGNEGKNKEHKSLNGFFGITVDNLYLSVLETQNPRKARSELHVPPKTRLS